MKKLIEWFKGHFTRGMPEPASDVERELNTLIHAYHYHQDKSDQISAEITKLFYQTRAFIEGTQ